MPDGYDKILETLGQLSGLMQATREDVKEVSATQKEHGNSIQTLAASIQVMQGCVQNIDIQTKNEITQVKKELNQANEKLGRDYERINVLEKDKNIANGINDYKEKKRMWWQYALGVCGAIIGILIGINQLVGIVQKVETTKLTSTSSVFAAPVKKDSNKTIIIETDTIRRR